MRSKTRRFVLLAFSAFLVLTAYAVFVPTYAGLEFYENLPGKYADCGNEIYMHSQRDRNLDMRTCFERAFQECMPAKLHKTGYTMEGDPVMTTILIEGKRQRSCIVRVHVNSRDRFGEMGSFQTICRNVTIRKMPSIYLYLSRCENGQDRWI